MFDERLDITSITKKNHPARFSGYVMYYANSGTYTVVPKHKALELFKMPGWFDITNYKIHNTVEVLGNGKKLQQNGQLQQNGWNEERQLQSQHATWSNDEQTFINKQSQDRRSVKDTQTVCGRESKIIKKKRGRPRKGV